MNMSISIKSLAEALSKAQAEMPAVKMNSVNPFLKNHFADLGAVIETSRPILGRHGLSISQFPTSGPDGIGVTTILSHASGEFIEDTIYMPLSEEKGKSAAQVAGSIITYLRRYSWSGVLGLYADEDTDGSGAGQSAAKKTVQADKATGEIKPDPNAAENAYKAAMDIAVTGASGAVKHLGEMSKPQLDSVVAKSSHPEIVAAARLVLQHDFNLESVKE